MIEPETVYAVSGFGSGTHVESLLERAGSGNFVFVGEEDPRTLGEVFLSKRFLRNTWRRAVPSRDG